MKKMTGILVMLVSLFFVLAGCDQVQAFDINDVDITAIDQINIPAGTYRLEYTIENWSDLVKNHGAELAIEVRNKSNQLVVLSLDTITVEIGEVYTVKLVVTIDGETIQKTFTVTAITAQQIEYSVTFDTQGGIGEYQAQTVSHGGIPNLPTTEPTKSGFVFTGWYYDVALTQFCDFATPIYEDITLYAGFEVIQNKVTVTFITNGANETFPVLQLNIGDFLPVLTTPTKTGYRFDGWYLEATFETAFLVEATNIYQNTTLYAKWVDTTLSTYKVTYDLNGALQSGEIFELVVQNDIAKGFGMTPVRTGYRLEGYALTPTGDELYDFSTPVTSDITLYAIWLYNYTEMEQASYFTEISILDNSMFDETFRIEQIMSFHATINTFRFKQDLNIDENITEFGILYSETEALTYQQRGIFKVSDLPFGPNVTYVDYLFNTEALKETTTYYVRAYLKFEDTIVYSDVQSFETIHVVKGGDAVGLNYVVSGGEYYQSDPQIQNHSVFFYEVLDGFEAKDNHHPYQSYQYISAQGLHRVIVTNLTTNEQYLHIYQLKFDKPFVNTTHFQTEVISPSSLKFEFKATLLHEDRYTYPISDAGFLYSRTTFALLKGVPGVHDADADYNESTDMILSTESITFNDRDSYYLRSYVVLSGKVHYSNLIYEVTFSTQENHYIIANAISVQSETTSIEYPYEYFLGSTPITLHYYDGSDVQKSTYSGTGAFTQAGVYFSYPQNTSMITILNRVGSYPAVTGVENFGQYDGPVLVEFLMPNAYMYMSYNGGDYVYLPYRVCLERVGYYTLYYRSATGMQSISFEIKQ
jgi:uncharacterized repeat protein (TIGR02543 family)